MLEVWLGNIVKCAFGVKDKREEYFEQYKEYEIYLVPRQEDVWDCSIYNYGKEVKTAQDIHLSKDEIIKLAKEWIDKL